MSIFIFFIWILELVAILFVPLLWVYCLINGISFTCKSLFLAMNRRLRKNCVKYAIKGLLLILFHLLLSVCAVYFVFPHLSPSPKLSVGYARLAKEMMYAWSIIIFIVSVIGVGISHYLKIKWLRSIFPVKVRKNGCNGMNGEKRDLQRGEP